MPKIDGQVKALLSDVRDIEENIPSLDPGRFPEAVIFVETITTSSFCGATFRSPNAHPLVRYNNKSTAVTKWTPSFNILKQEKQEINIRSDKCSKCW